MLVKGFISLTITLRHNNQDSIAVVHLQLNGSYTISHSLLNCEIKNLGSSDLKHARYEISCNEFHCLCFDVQNSLINSGIFFQFNIISFIIVGFQSNEKFCNCIVISHITNNHGVKHHGIFLT